MCYAMSIFNLWIKPMYFKTILKFYEDWSNFKRVRAPKGNINRQISNFLIFNKFYNETIMKMSPFKQIIMIKVEGFL